MSISTSTATPDPETLARLQFLARVVHRTAAHLQTTSTRLFTEPMSPARIAAMANDDDLAEQVDAFVSRFGRLQDLLGDKLLPLLLGAFGERPAPVIDRLDRAEKLGLLPSANDWLATRQLRNQMIHEYIEDRVILADALNAAHHNVAMLTGVADRLRAELVQRGWA